MLHVLGIDAGGTKTVCLLAGEDGSVIAEARRGGANLQAVGELEVEKVLHDVMEEALGNRDIVPAAICLGIAGVDRPADAAVVRAIMKRIGYKAPEEILFLDEMPLNPTGTIDRVGLKRMAEDHLHPQGMGSER